MEREKENLAKPQLRLPRPSAILNFLLTLVFGTAQKELGLLETGTYAYLLRQLAASTGIRVNVGNATVGGDGVEGLSAITGAGVVGPISFSGFVNTPKASKSKGASKGEKRRNGG